MSSVGPHWYALQDIDQPVAGCFFTFMNSFYCTSLRSLCNKESFSKGNRKEIMCKKARKLLSNNETRLRLSSGARTCSFYILGDGGGVRSLTASEGTTTTDSFPNRNLLLVGWPRSLDQKQRGFVLVLVNLPYAMTSSRPAARACLPTAQTERLRHCR